MNRIGFVVALFGENLDRLSDELLAKIEAVLRGQIVQPIDALIHHRAVNEIFFPSRRGGAWSWRKTERVGVDEFHTIDDVEGLREFVIRLTGEANDDVGRDRWAIECCIHAVDHAAEIIASVLAIHAAEERIRSALQWQMKMGDDLGMLLHRGDQGIGQVAGFEAAKPQAVEGGDFGAQSRNQVGHRMSIRLGLAAAERRELAESAEEDSGQHDLPMAGLDQSPGFLDHIVDRLAPQARPKLRDDAVGAMGIATVLNLEHRALMPILTLIQ